MQTVIIVVGSSLALTVLLAAAAGIANLAMRFIPPGRFRDSLVLPHTERKDWLLVWLPFALFGLFVLIVLHFSH